MKSDNIYFVYAYLDPRKPGKYIYDGYKFDYEPFYIGKGKGSRHLRHLSGEYHNVLKNNKINKIRSIGLEPIVVKVIEKVKNEDSLIIEKKLIDRIGRICKYNGPLTNVSDGGDDYVEFKQSDEYKKTLYKPVIQYDLYGNIIKEWESIDSAANGNGLLRSVVSQSCRGLVKIVKDKWIFLYKDDPFEKRIREKKVSKIYSIDRDGSKVEWESMTECSKTLNIKIGEICDVLKVRKFNSNGYIFRYNGDDLFDKKYEKWFKYIVLIDKKVIYKDETFKNILYAITESEKKLHLPMVYEYKRS